MMPTSTLKSTDPDRESGMSLVELLIYMMLSVMVLGIVGSMFINGLRTEKIVTAMSQTTTAGQLAATSVQQGIRNSTGFSVENLADNDQFVLARTAGSGEVLEYFCQAWYYSDSDHTLRTTTSPTAIAVPTSAPLGWTIITEGVAPQESGFVFTQLAAQIEIEFIFTPQGQEPINIQSSARSRATSMEIAPCA